MWCHNEFKGAERNKICRNQFRCGYEYLTLLASIAILAGCSKDDPFSGLESAFGPKLKTVTYYIQTNQGDFRPGEKIEFSYVGGQLISETQSEYDVTTKSFDFFSTTTYTYDADKLVRIEKQITGSSTKVITRYEYQNDKISRILVDDGVDTDATVKYLQADTVEVFYNYSNGRFFTYRFKTKGDNIVYEQTRNESNQVSSETMNEYDSFKNPFKLLGYTDLLFSNYSVNNKVKISASYYSDAFPTSVPAAFDYEYNNLKYPTTLITTYKSTGSSGATGKSRTVFEYAGVD
jgi:hypothetical protein